MWNFVTHFSSNIFIATDMDSVGIVWYLNLCISVFEKLIIWEEPRLLGAGMTPVMQSYFSVIEGITMWHLAMAVAGGTMRHVIWDVVSVVVCVMARDECRAFRWLESWLLLSVRPCWQPSYCLSCYTSILLLYLKVIVILVLFSALVILMCMALMFKILV